MAAFLGIAALVRGCDGAQRAAGCVMSSAPQQRLWDMFEDSSQAWKIVFGADGERGEYMDGYSEQAMLDRCAEDYNWRSKFSPETQGSVQT